MTRSFDPVLSAALRNELEHLADREATRPARPAAAARPQVWITAVTAVLLVVATLGLLRITGGSDGAPAAARPGDPLTAAHGPLADAELRGTPVTVLAQGRAIGGSRFRLSVPEGTTRLTAYATCGPAGSAKLELLGFSGSGECAPASARAFTLQDPGSGPTELRVDLPSGVAARILVIAVAPSSTTTLSQLRVHDLPAGLRDPLTEILDPRSDAYIRAAPDVLLGASGTGSRDLPVVLPAGTTSVRPYLNCSPETRQYSVGVDEGSMHGECSSGFGGSFGDVPMTPGAHTVRVRVPKGTAWSLVLIATPVYTPATAGPVRALLPYPSGIAPDRVLGRERGAFGIVTGRLEGTMTRVSVTITCQGDGTVTVATPFGTAGNPAERASCGARSPKRTSTGMGGPERVTDPRFTITPYGDVRWTVTFTRDE